MTCSNNFNNSIIHVITSKELCLLHNNGFKLVPLSDDNKPVTQWSPIYDNPSYWQIDDFTTTETSSMFKNVASTVGKTHLKDSEGKELYLQVLDCDSEIIYDIITKRSLASAPLEKINNFLDELEIKVDEKEFNNLTLFDILKAVTFVTKTRKLYGLHLWWLSHSQNKSIKSLDCKKGFEYEIKTDKSNGLCNLPPSTHRNDKNFRYTAIGRTDKLLISDQLYDLFCEIFNEYLLSSNNVDGNDIKKQNIVTASGDKVATNKKLEEQQQQQVPQLDPRMFYNLSAETIKLTVTLLLPFYKVGNRHDFAMFFSGTVFHYRVSEVSATSIIESICNKANDIQEKPDRLNTLHCTYKKGFEGKPLVGGPTLADLMSRVSGCDIAAANDLINNLKRLWQQEISKEISIAKAKRAKSGIVKIKGTIIGISPVYHMIKSISSTCEICGWFNKKDFQIPRFKASFKERDSCPQCFKDDSITDTVNVSCEYITVVDLEVQDVDGYNEIERLPVKLFEKDTFDIAAGEVATICGKLQVVRKNDCTKNKLETFLFADSIEYVKRQEIILTEKDIQLNEQWKLLQEKEGKNPIDALVSLLAPELIDLDNVKKGILLACVNAGYRNVDTRFPKKIRINVLVIGDPGLAKTSLLQKTLPLIPSSQYAGGQSSTGLSLTAQISKEDGGGMYTLRFGPVVLAKDSICLINEIGQLPIEEHKHLLDCMEENGFPIAKYGFFTMIEAHPTIIASANPINNKWQNNESISAREFPTLSQIIQRFDLIFILRENTTPSHLSKYVEKRKKIANDYKKGIYEGNEEFIKKYLLHARTFKPELTDEAHSLLNNFYINMGKAGISGLPRKLDSLLRITIAIAKLKLKDVADVYDAQEAMLFYNDILKDFNQTAALAANPRDLAYEEIRKAIKENNGSPIPLTEAAIIACDKNKDVKYYFLGKRANNSASSIREHLKLNSNWHLKEILELIKNDDCLHIILDKPITIRWKGETNDRANNTLETIEKVQSTPSKLDPGTETKIECNKVAQNQNIVAVACFSDSLTRKPCDGCDVCDGQNKKEELHKKTDNEIVSSTSNVMDKSNICDIQDSRSQDSKLIPNNKTNSLDNKYTIPFSICFQTSLNR